MCMATCGAFDSGHRSDRGLERLKQSRGLPEVIITDNGSEFRSRAFDSWAYARGVKLLDFIQRRANRSRTDSCESFNGTLRNECLNLHLFLSIPDAKHSSSNGELTTTKFVPTAPWVF